VNITRSACGPAVSATVPSRRRWGASASLRTTSWSSIHSHELSSLPVTNVQSPVAGTSSVASKRST
jgi:hypothetical protein